MNGCQAVDDPVSIPLTGLIQVGDDSAPFIVGPENRLVEAAVAALSAGQTGLYNPLVLVGLSGTGKSHLARGLADLWKLQFGRHVCYTTGDDFFRDLTDAQETQAVDEFRGRHRRVDLLVLEHLERLAERHSAQEIAAFTRVLRKYKPSLEFWQGEAGVQSYVPEKAKGVGALSNMKASESIQARMLLRRFLLELHNGCGMTSYFHMSDFAHYAAFKETFHYGLIRLQDGSPKPAYYAMQTLATLLCDPMEPAAGRTAAHLSLLDDTNDPRATRAATWNANFVRGDVPVHAWWFPESVEDDPVIRRMEMTFWMDCDLRLERPVLIEPVTQEVYELNCTFDRRTCAESWMSPDPDAEGVRVFSPLPVSTSPLFLTDRSICDIA